MFIDTHAHLWWPTYVEDLDEVLARAKVAGVNQIVVPGTDIESSKKAIELAKKYPGFLYAAVGIHPEETITESFKVRPSLASSGWALPLRSDLRELITKNREQVVAIGEIGIDLYTPQVQATLEQQKSLFKIQLELANELDLPVIIHTRNSFPETWEVLSSLSRMPRGQFHCFSVDEEALSQVITAGFYTSFCANITWSKRVAKLVEHVPDDRLLLETDSPFMAPKSRNEPAQVAMLATKIGELRSTATEKIGEMTIVNAKRLYRL